ncbi:helix-turn-helix transcriptional regulator [Faecalibacter sp. LW9]|uniref:helix-turn-helix domain-containing protein n=1 Tax=Faecalibacter sp. LW9 TaxID=3103144 RepID=UPI002AFF71A4|nr:helix-turn-helix transcriptional regulator [Faecalibacter sp. LW9]
MSKIGFNIRKIRESKGFSQDYMASVLNISQASYARLENEDTKVTVDRLYKIAEILDTNIIDFFDADRMVIQNQTNNEGAFGNGYVENLNVGNKNVYEQLLKSKDEQIELLTKMIDKLLKK